MSVDKSTKEYLRNFYRAYIVEKPLPKDLESWCKSNLGKQYLDWTIWKKGFNHIDYYDALCKIYIRDPKRCTLFELKWSNIIVAVDKKVFAAVK